MKEVEIFLTKQVQHHETPSVQYLIFDQHRVIDRFTTGLAQIENEVKADESTTYNAFSVTKTFTALAVLQLAEQHKVNVQDPIINYLPNFPYSSEISIIHLLSHTSGIPNPVPLSWIHLLAEHPQFDSRNFFVRVFSKNRKLKSLSDGKFAYSNLGYVFLGQLIERVSGLSYEDFIVRNIITPLDLKPSELSFRIHDPAKHAKGYHKILSLSYAVLGFLIDRTKYFDKKEGTWKSFKNYYVNGAPYGGLIGTPAAFMKYLQELLKPGNKLISDEFKKLLFSPVSINKSTGMYLSWFSGELNGHKYFAHAGGGGGYYCEIRIYPGPGIASVIFYNRTGMKDERMLDKVDRYYL